MATNDWKDASHSSILQPEADKEVREHMFRASYILLY